jgi:eukaryotic-like serine/threonine-protein kinase
MASTTACPDDPTLQQFALGLVSAPDAELYEKHLTGCRRCVQRLQDLAASDVFVEALQDQKDTAEPPTPLVQELMRRLDGMGPSPNPRSARLTPPSENTESLFAFLGPPQGPNELGWLGGFRILEVLGVGGMGVVFEAEDVKLHRRVAIKTMKPLLAGSQSARQRFLREARAMAALTHDHIVPILNVGEDRDMPFVVMPLLQGETLEARLVRDKQLPVAELLRIGREITVALAAAHEKGVIHRDVKPANVWLERGTDRVKILDFGLARASGQDLAASTAGAILGTPGYMAPEQARGHLVDQRCDLFSLGCVLYQASTGRPPFAGADMLATLFAVVNHQPPVPLRVNPTLPPRLSALIVQMLAKDPADRPATATAVADALDGITPQPVRQAAWWPWAVSAALSVVVLGMAGALIFRPGPDTGSTTPKVAETRQATQPETKPPVVGEIGRFNEHTDAVQCVAFLPDGKHALSGGWDRIVRLWDVDTFKEVRQLKGHVAGVQCLAISKDGKRALTAGGTKPEQKDDKANFAIILWNLDTGAEIKRYNGHTDLVSGLAFLPREDRFLSASWDTTLRVWDIVTGKDVQQFVWPKERRPLPLRGLSLAPNGKEVAAATADAVVQRWNIASGKSEYWFQALPMDLDGLAWTPTEEHLIVGGLNGILAEWNPEKVSPVRHFEGHDGRVWSVAVSPDGRRLLSGSLDRTVRLWDRQSGKNLQTFTGHTKGVQSVTFSPDGQRALSASGDTTIRLWQLP